ncbi:MAG: MopE-related protein, partial [Myxococcota bacterium]
MWSWGTIAGAASLQVGVGQPFADLGSALAAAAPGDRVVVHPGVYPAVALTDGVELVSVDGPAVTTIVAGAGPAVRLDAGAAEVRGFTLDGAGVDRAFTNSGALTLLDVVLTGGVADTGGCGWSDGELVLSRATLTNCTAATYGGGLFVDHGATILSVVRFTGNTAVDGRGGGLYVQSGTAILRGVWFDANLADAPGGDPVNALGGGLYISELAVVSVFGGGFTDNAVTSYDPENGKGGAVRVRSSTLAVFGATFSNNSATEVGAGIAATDATLIVDGSRFLGNRIDEALLDPPYGGTVYCEAGSDCTVSDSWFEGNSAGDGAAICTKSDLVVSGSMFCDNAATSDGGAIDAGNVDTGVVVDVSGSVFSQNSTDDQGGAMVVTDRSAVSLRNNHFVANTGPNGSAVTIGAETAAFPVLSRNNLFTENTGADAWALTLYAGAYDEDYDWFFANEPGDFDHPLGPSTGVDDPRLVGPAASCSAADLVPSPDSPLLGAGEAAPASPVDVGAFVGTDPGLFADADADGVAAMVDCDDSELGVTPDAVEVCNGVDDDCDGLADADGGAVDGAWLHFDSDLDGLGDATVAGFVCPAPGWVVDATDCDDADAASGSLGLYWTDSDGDGFGAGDATTVCGPPGDGQVEVDGDCDDAAGDVHPGADDPPGGGDTNCDGLDGDPYADSDGDGVSDGVELEWGTDPADPDTDHDGWSDGEEGPLDTDADGVIDALDPDDDGDGWATADEPRGDADADGHENHLDADADGDGAADGGDPEPLDPGGASGVAPAPPGGCSSSPLAGGGWIAAALVLWRRTGSRAKGTRGSPLGNGARFPPLPRIGGEGRGEGAPAKLARRSGWKSHTTRA